MYINDINKGMSAHRRLQIYRALRNDIALDGDAHDRAIAFIAQHMKAQGREEVPQKLIQEIKKNPGCVDLNKPEAVKAVFNAELADEDDLQFKPIPIDTGQIVLNYLKDHYWNKPLFGSTDWLADKGNIEVYPLRVTVKCFRTIINVVRAGVIFHTLATLLKNLAEYLVKKGSTSWGGFVSFLTLIFSLPMMFVAGSLPSEHMFENDGEYKTWRRVMKGISFALKIAICVTGYFVVLNPLQFFAHDLSNLSSYTGDGGNMMNWAYDLFSNSTIDQIQGVISAVAFSFAMAIIGVATSGLKLLKDLLLSLAENHRQKRLAENKSLLNIMEVSENNQNQMPPETKTKMIREEYKRGSDRVERESSNKVPSEVNVKNYIIEENEVKNSEHDDEEELEDKFESSRNREEWLGMFKNTLESESLIRAYYQIWSDLPTFDDLYKSIQGANKMGPKALETAIRDRAENWSELVWDYMDIYG